MKRLYDKKGIPIYCKDVLKVFHFIGKRRKRHYMYKQASMIVGRYLVVNHLTGEGNYKLILDDSVLNDYEIVEGYAGVPAGGNFEDRVKK